MKLEGVELPQSLRDQLHAVETRLCRIETIIAICGGLIGLFATLLILYFSDRLWDTPVLLRLTLLVVGALAVGWFSFYWMRNWVFRRRNYRELAKLVQKRHPRLGDRLQGVVELTDGGDIPEGTSPELCEAAINQVADQSQSIDFTTAVSSRRSRWFAVGALALLAGVIAPLFISSNAWKNMWARMFNPTAERYTFVQLEDLPGERIVPHGENFTIAVAIDEKSERKPDYALAQVIGQPKKQAEIVDGGALFHVDGQIEDVQLRIKVGDASRVVSILPRHRPDLRELNADVALPAYLERPQESVKVTGGHVELLEGSRMVINGRINRDVKEVFMREGEDGDLKNLDVVKNQFATPEYAAETLTEAEFDWKDEHGLKSSSPYPLSVATVKDRKPVADLRGIERSVAILMDEVVNIEVSANDDFGLRDLKFHYEDIDNIDKGLADAFGTEIVGKGDPQQLAINGSVRIAPRINEIPEGSTLQVYATSRDYKPDHQAATSAVHKIYIMNRAEHAARVQAAVEKILDKLDDIARDEEALIEENKDLQNGKPENLSGQKGQKKLGKQELSEMRQADRMRKLAEEMKEALKDAQKNRDIPEQTMREWSEFQQGMDKLSKQELKQASRNLQQAGQKKDQQDRQKELGKAIEQQEQALKKMRDMEQKANKSIENMLLVTSSTASSSAPAKKAVSPTACNRTWGN